MKSDEHPQDSNIHEAITEPTCVLLVPNGPHVGPTNLAIRDKGYYFTSTRFPESLNVSMPSKVSHVIIMPSPHPFPQDPVPVHCSVINETQLWPVRNWKKRPLRHTLDSLFQLTLKYKTCYRFRYTFFYYRQKSNKFSRGVWNCNQGPFTNMD